MATRRDELNAYTFSRRRTVAAFLRPAGGGADNEVPRPMRAVVPGLVLGAVALAAFGAWGLISPSAPSGWKTANAIIVGKSSTTRYVMEDKTLYPVLNVASARLVLGNNPTVEEVPDSALDKVPHGPTIGIPYAPDWLPTDKDAASAKTWVVCDQPGSGGGSTEQHVYILGGAQQTSWTQKHTLPAGQGLFVSSGGKDYVVIGGTAYPFPDGGLAPGVFGATASPAQPVTAAWLATLNQGPEISKAAAEKKFPGLGSAQAKVGGTSMTVGTVLEQDYAGKKYYFVAGPNGPIGVDPFAEQFMLQVMGQTAPRQMAGTLSVAEQWHPGWPSQGNTQQADSARTGKNVVCGSYTTQATNGQGPKQPASQAWAGTALPPYAAPAGTDTGAAGGESSQPYVTPGTGMLLREGTGESGKHYLLTDSGLRYPVQVNGDAGTSAASSGGGAAGGAAASPSPTAGSTASASSEQRLGYGRYAPVPVPEALVGLVPSGPLLDFQDARLAHSG